MGRPKKAPSIDDQIEGLKTKQQPSVKTEKKSEISEVIVKTLPKRSKERVAYDGLRIKELRMLARKNGCRGWNKRTRNGLVAMLIKKGVVPVLIALFATASLAQDIETDASSKITTRRNQAQEIKNAIEERAPMSDSTLYAHSAMFAGTAAFTTSDTVDTLVNDDIAATDLFFVSLEDTTAGAYLKGIKVKADTLFIARHPGGLSAAVWNWLRVKLGY